MSRRSFLCVMLAVKIGVSGLCSSCSNDEGDAPVFPHGTQVLNSLSTDENMRGIDKFLSLLDDFTDCEIVSDTLRYGALVDGVPVAAIIYADKEKDNVVHQKLIMNCGIEQQRNNVYTPFEHTTFLYRTYSYRVRTKAKYDTGECLLRTWVDGVPGEWHYENVRCEAPIYGKTVAILGASFANYTQGGGELNLPYGDGNYGFQDFLAERLGCSRLDNYAQPGHGWYAGKTWEFPWPFFAYNTYVQTELVRKYTLSQGMKYDVYILFAGLNDFKQNIPIGDYSLPETDETYCGSIKMSINNIRKHSPDAKIFMLSSFKSYSYEEYGDAACNPNTTVTNGIGELYFNYHWAFKNAAKTENIPYFDIYAAQSSNPDNFTTYYLPDCVHPNGTGYYDIGWRLLDFLYDNYTE